MIVISSISSFAARAQGPTAPSTWTTTVEHFNLPKHPPSRPRQSDIATSPIAPGTQLGPRPSMTGSASAVAHGGDAQPLLFDSTPEPVRPLAYMSEPAAGLGKSGYGSLIEPHVGMALTGLAFVLAASLLLDFGSVLVAFTGNRARRPRLPVRAASRQDVEATAIRDDCCRLVDEAGRLWRQAEPAVLRLEERSALRNYLLKELADVTKRLSTASVKPSSGGGALTVGAPLEYWMLLRQRLRRAVRDLARIRSTADAALSSVGSRDELPGIPTTRSESMIVLGANREVDEQTLQRLVRALRQCWHPDLARSDEDRIYRNARIAQINVAYDILSGRRAES